MRINDVFIPAEEIERRSKEIESGKARLIPGDEVFAKIKIRIGK